MRVASARSPPLTMVTESREARLCGSSSRVVETPVVFEGADRLRLLQLGTKVRVGVFEGVLQNVLVASAEVLLEPFIDRRCDQGLPVKAEPRGLLT